MKSLVKNILELTACGSHDKVISPVIDRLPMIDALLNYSSKQDRYASSIDGK